MSDAKFTLNEAGIQKLRNGIFNGLADMSYDIQRDAQRRAPVVSGNLRSTIKYRPAQGAGMQFEVTAGGMSGGVTVDYAYKRELGPNRLASTEHYLEYAARDVASGDYINKYFGGITL